jgi:hypothetical protein
MSAEPRLRRGRISDKGDSMNRFRRLAIIPALTLAAVTAACEAGDRKGAARSGETTAAASEPPRPARRLAVAPSDCSGPAPRTVAFGNYGNLIGSAPVCRRRLRHIRQC